MSKCASRQGVGGAILRGGSSDIHQGVVVVVGYPGVFWGGGGAPGPSATPRLIPRQTLFWSSALGARHEEETEPVKDCFTPAG